MRTTLTIFYMLVAGLSFSCSLAYKSFCETSNIRQGDMVIRGVITDSVTHGIRLKLINTIRGTEARDTVTVWDATDIECNGPFPQRTSLMGAIGDTILVAMNLVDSIAEPWQVIGDYLYPDNFGFTPHLIIRDDTLLGFISGSQMAPEQFNVWKMDFSDWLTYWNTHGNSCTMLVGIKEEDELQLTLLPNPAQSTLYLQNSNSHVPVKIFAPSGVIVTNSIFVNGQLDISSLAAGIYYAEITMGNKTQVKKFVKAG
ncbi:MAG TPA: T9SS type A sorting domain-containing protein [Chitinophagales bacterium]|nr:T9SS type A sorting domain-containing protein [Chitinophagales bacterium]